MVVAQPKPSRFPDQQSLIPAPSVKGGALPFRSKGMKDQKPTTTTKTTAPPDQKRRSLGRTCAAHRIAYRELERTLAELQDLVARQTKPEVTNG